MNSSDMSRKIKNLRLDKGLTLEQVGNMVGVGKSTVRKWETGMIANMKRDKIHLLAKALGVTPAYLMGWEETNKEEAELLNLIKQLDEDEVKELSNFVDYIISKRK